MNTNHFEKWERTRQKGMWHYVFTSGVCFWGGFMFVAMAFVNDPFSVGLLSFKSALHCVVWPVGGALFGLVTWWQFERRRKTNLAKQG